MTVTKSFSVEFDDSLLSYEGWKAPRFEGSKLIARHLNVYTPPALIGGTGKNIQFRGSNPPNSLDRRDLDQYFNAIGGMIIRTGSKLVAGRHINYSHVSASLNIRVNVDPFVEPTTQNRKNWGGDILGPKRAAEATWHGAHPTDPSKKGNGWYTRTIGGKKLTKTIAGIPS